MIDSVIWKTSLTWDHSHIVMEKIICVRLALPSVKSSGVGASASAVKKLAKVLAVICSTVEESQDRGDLKRFELAIPWDNPSRSYHFGQGEFNVPSTGIPSSLSYMATFPSFAKNDT